MMRDDFPKRITKWAEVQALKDAGRLTPAEVKLIEAAQTGEGAFIGTSVPTTKSDAVLIRAPLIRYLALGGCEDCEVEAAGVQVAGAWIDGVIDLRYATAKGRLALVHCYIADRMEMLQCTLLGLNLNSSALPKALNAQDAQFAKDVILNEISADGEVCLSGATIGGQLACVGAILGNPDGFALNAQGAQIADDVFLRWATFAGEVRLSGATIGGQLSCVGAKLNNPDGDALNAYSTQIAGGVFLRGATADGEVRLSGATIGGPLACEEATLRNTDGFALNAQDAQITKGVFVRDATSYGEVRLCRATIGGQLSCEGATFWNTAGTALNLQRTVVKDGFFWRDIKAVVGLVDLSSAYVKEIVDDTESWVKCDSLSILHLVYDSISPNVALTDRLRWLRVGANLNGEIHPQPFDQFARVLRDRGDMTAARKILFLKESSLRSATRRTMLANRELLGYLRWSSRGHVSGAQLRLQSILSRTSAFYKETEQFFTEFSRLHSGPASIDSSKFVHARLRPYERQLAQQDYRNRLFAASFHIVCRNFVHSFVDKLYGAFLGYGYKLYRSLYAFLFLIFLGILVADGAWRAGDFAPNSDVILISDDWQALATNPEDFPNPARTWSDGYVLGIEHGGQGQDYTTFNAALYAVDVVVPIISLGQEEAWAPSTNRGSWGGWLFLINPVLALLGWVVTLIGAAAVPYLIRKE